MTIWEKLHNMQLPLYIAQLTAVSMGQVKSKDALAQMIETMHFV